MITKDTYKEKILDKIVADFSYENKLAAPKLEKIVLNIGVSSSKDRTALEEASNHLAAITGQKSIPTIAKKAIAGFKIREGNKIGTKVTLRKQHMYEFLSRLIHNALPRVRDFQGVNSKAFDGRGNYTLGIKDLTIFQEIEIDKMRNNFGLNITFVTSAKTNEEAKALLNYFGMPFSKRG